jgi:hypothetical protein
MPAPKDNQILRYHRARERCYDLTGLRTGSVRDQLLRAITLTRSLMTITKEIRSGRKPRDLLVLGGGVSGVACALIAARKGIKVTLLELEPANFFSTIQRSSRRIAPFEYDWPRSSDPNSLFTSRKPRFLLNYRSGRAKIVCAVWQKRLMNWRATDPHRGDLELLNGVDARTFVYDLADAVSRTVTVRGNWSNGMTARKFGAVIDCTGHVEERTFVEDPTDDGRPPTAAFCGPRFWKDEDFLDDRTQFFAQPGAGPVKTILISGGGDGAMQDIQRAVTGRFGDPLFRRFLAHLGLGSLREHFYELAEADDAARRAYAWKLHRGEVEEMKTCDETFRKVARTILDDYAKQAPNQLWASQLARKIFKPAMLGKGSPTVVWAVRESHCGYAYPLNRLLSHLVAFLLEELTQTKVLHFDKRIDTIDSASSTHQCGNPLWDCYGHPHEVTFKGETASRKFDLVIVRHGVIFPESAIFGTRAPIPEQLVPYELPR